MSVPYMPAADWRNTERTEGETGREGDREGERQGERERDKERDKERSREMTRVQVIRCLPVVLHENSEYTLAVDLTRLHLGNMSPS